MNLSFYIVIFLFGLCIGSFINCLVWRIHKKESILNRSYCPKCIKKIAWHDNIPLLSFFVLGGRCRHCRKKISWQYPVVELITAILFVFALYKTPAALEAPGLLFVLRNWFIISIMTIIFIYDFRWQLIPDIITLPACAIIFILNIFLGYNWLVMLFCGIIGGSFFLIQFLISRGKWIGGGDIRLGLFMGLALAKIPELILALFLAYLAGAIIGIGLIIAKKKKWGSEIPLGIFLSTAAVIALFWGEIIVDWYLNLI